MSRKLRIYRPLRTDPDALEAVTVGRESILDDILRTLGRWEPGASRQHHLIIGPRGIGKTHLLQLIRHRIGQSASLKSKWWPVSFGEEEYGITKTADLLLSALGILARETDDPSLKTAHDQLRYDDDDQKVIDRALDALRRFHAARGCGLLLMTENMDQLLERQIKSPRDLRGLRKILIEEDWIALIWTSPTYLSAVTNPEHPFFEFFRTINLSELTVSEQEEMLGKMASLEGNPSFEEERPRWRSRLEALHHFTGGNPRLTVMLYNLVVNQRITEVREELDHLLDELTPYYQDRMKTLPAHEAKL